MRRFVLYSIGVVVLINLIGISLICFYFLNLSKEVEKTLLLNRSLLVRTAVFEKSLFLLDELKGGKRERARILISDISRIFTECYTCHHREDTLSRINATRDLFDRTSREMSRGEKINSGDISMVIQGFVTYAFKKAKDSVSTQTGIVAFYLDEIKRSVSLTIGITFIVFLFFSYYAFRRGSYLEGEIKERERVITDWALEWQNTFDAMQDMVIVFGQDNKPHVFNAAAMDFFGTALFLGDDLLKTLGLDPAGLNNPISTTVEIKDRLLSLKVYPLNEMGKRCIIVLRDITKEMELEEKLKRAEKLATLGLMAGGVAHEVNNPLSPIIGYSEVLYDLEEDEKKREYLRQIIAAAERIRNIVNDLLSFAREHSLKMARVRLDECIDGVIKTLEGIRPLGGVRIIKDLEYVEEVNIDRGLFEIALLNILKNAIQAIEESKQGDSIRISATREDSVVRIEISDNGPGIPEKLVPYIFDPFFSTKEFGKGTGLGLSITHRIITAHKGEITVRSKRGEGTTFSIRLPR